MNGAYTKSVYMNELLKFVRNMLRKEALLT
jgi:hypothetical protein